ncbi:phosphoenolpyruvate--protein phosphotransferase [Clostridia bacterium]|nr:phosphoenolpyruvate--protein phosphotransferase [Clostridia bacterium]
MIRGIGVSDGIVIGKVFKHNQAELVINKETISDVKKEIEKLDEALRKSVADVEKLRVKTEKNADADTAAIFGAHIEILKDPELRDGTICRIENEHINADFAFQAISDSFVDMFEAMEDEYFRERALDVKDVSKRVLMYIQGKEMVSLSSLEEEVVLVARDLTPSDTAELEKGLVKGFITDIGGRTSHTAIMARILEIPAVVGTKVAFETLNDGDMVVLDGLSGRVVANPTEEEIKEYEAIAEEHERNKAIWETFKDKESLTKDNKQVEISANIGKAADIQRVLDHGAEGIGLYRTEFLFMGRSDWPNEEEQLKSYRMVLESMGNKPVVIRTLDIGGDKNLDYLKMDEELNPFLGVRALRLCMSMPDIFRTQLRALLRASVFGNLHIMFPMVATVDEFREAKRLLQEVEQELVEEGKEVSSTYKTGIMVEIPSAAILADAFAPEVDFFSIGSNDLIQYTFASDRMNEKVSYLYQTCNPSILRLISMVIEAAHKEGKWVGMCGEMAGDVRSIPLLLGLGLDEFSMSASGVLKARHFVSEQKYENAKALAKKALQMKNQDEVLELLDEYKNRK